MQKTSEVVVRNDKSTGYKSALGAVTTLGVMALSMAPAHALELTEATAELGTIPAIIGAFGGGVILIALTIKGIKWAIRVL